MSECNGICLTAADIGLPEYGNQVAYGHPDCPLHGDGNSPRDGDCWYRLEVSGTEGWQPYMSPSKMFTRMPEEQAYRMGDYLREVYENGPAHGNISDIESF